MAFHDAVATSASMLAADLTSSVANDMVTGGVRASNIHLSAATAKGSILTGADLTGANAATASLQGTVMRGG